MPLTFSIVTSTWNSEPYLAKSIASVLAQDHPAIEYIFVDGGSTDGTLERIRRIPRETKLLTDVRGGVSAAMNAGLAVATGDVVAHLHSDDYYLYPQVLSDVAETLERTGAEWLFARCLDDVDGQLLPENWQMPRYSYRRLLKGNFISQMAVFVRKPLFDRVGRFDPGLKYAMDYDMYLRLGRLAEPHQLDRHLAAFRKHAGSLSTANPLPGLDEDFRVRLKYAGRSPWGLAYHGAHYLVRRWRLARAAAAASAASAA